MKRYQECHNIIKLWRRRWYLLAPFIFIYQYIRYGYMFKEDPKLSRILLWSIVISELEFDKMKYYWTSDEVFSKIRNKNEKNT